MTRFPIRAYQELETRKRSGSFRELGSTRELRDFSSNDYLGFSKNSSIYTQAGIILEDAGLVHNGAKGSRLLTGNHSLYHPTEMEVAAYHCAPSALIFTSGYDANLGIIGALPGREDYIFYDEFIHASLRDGIRLAKAKAVKFKHNDLHDLKKKLDLLRDKLSGQLFVITESVFSMDGDSPDLPALISLTEENDIYLIVDEAHAVGPGLLVEKELHDRVFARIVTFGKAIGTHGAAVLGSTDLRDYLVNFARSFIYTTALPPHSLASILAAYKHLSKEGTFEIEKLQRNIDLFKLEIEKRNLQNSFRSNTSAIHTCILPGNQQVKKASDFLARAGFDVRPILSPTVPLGTERLRICLHSFNAPGDIVALVEQLDIILKAQ